MESVTAGAFGSGHGVDALFVLVSVKMPIQWPVSEMRPVVEKAAQEDSKAGGYRMVRIREKVNAKTRL